MRQVHKILIYGAPGAGKMTLSPYLKLRLSCQFFRRPEPNTATERAFQASRYIQEYLLEEAERLSVEMLEDVGSLKELAKGLD